MKIAFKLLAGLIFTFCFCSYISLHNSISCLATGLIYITKDVNGQRKPAEFWRYDEQGRVIADSCIGCNMRFKDGTGTFYFKYKGDSIIITGHPTWGPIVVLTNNAGLPVKMITHYGASVVSGEYNKDGSLKKIVAEHVWPNGQKNILITDSILYANGNIIAYREKTPGPSEWIVLCDYDTSKVYKNAVNPVNKIFALGDPFANPGPLQLQSFSKNLLSQEIWAANYKWSTISNYEYEFDEAGGIRAVHMTTNVPWQGHNKIITTGFTFQYNCN